MRFKKGQAFKTKLDFIWGLPKGSVVYASADGDTDAIKAHFMEWKDGKMKRKISLDWLELIEEKK
jgi:hypothetical protein